MGDTLKTIVLLSGGGRTLENLIEVKSSEGLPVAFDLVISSNPDAYGLTRARNHGIETCVVSSRDHRCAAPFGRGMMTDWDSFSRAINNIVLPRNPDLIIFAGFMCLYLLPPELHNKAMNIHPALIPSFCGQGMYGHHVHEAVVKSGVKVTGCTVHFVTNEYDDGPIIVQRTCPVIHTDTPDIVAERVFAEERKAYPEAIRLFANGRLSVEDGVVNITDKESS